MPKLIKISDAVTRQLRRQAAAVKNKRPLLTAMGRSMVSMGKRAFTDASLRPIRWKARKDKLTHPLLQLNVDLKPSLRITGYGGASVSVGSHLPYAAAQQLGSDKLNLPARPFFPFINNKLTDDGNKILNRTIRSYLKARGIG